MTCGSGQRLKANEKTEAAPGFRLVKQYIFHWRVRLLHHFIDRHKRAGPSGTCLTMEEMLQLVFNYEKVQKKWSNKELDLVSNTKVKVPELQLVPPKPTPAAFLKHPPI